MVVYRYVKLAAEKSGGAVVAGAGAGAEGIGKPNDYGDIENLESEGQEWIAINEAYVDDDDDHSDYDDDSEASSDSDSDSDSESSDSGSSGSESEADKPRSRKRSSSLPKTKDIELESGISFEEEQEFHRLSREFARQLQEEEAKREAAEWEWSSEGGGKKGAE